MDETLPLNPLHTLLPVELPFTPAMARTVGQVEWVHHSRAAAHRPSCSEGGSATTSSGSTGNRGSAS